MKKRCQWCEQDPLYQSYHDNEWGVPLYSDHRLFEFLLLEGAQAGLSWITVLKKRDNYRRAFAHFDPEKIAGFSEKKQQALLNDPGIIRNKLKVKAFVSNAQAYLKLMEKGVCFSDFLWRFVDGKPIQNHWQTLDAIPATTPVADALSKALKQAGFTFVGPTICYAFMQATGMVNDHVTPCFRHAEVKRLV